jgi:hypothetical protein
LIELILLKLCFENGELEKFIEENADVATIIHASYDDIESEIESEYVRKCYAISIEEW